MNGMMDFGSGPGGPMITGKWINRQTGTVINVRDSIIDGDKMLLMTDHGNISFDEFSSKYIQASDDIYDINGNKVGTSEALAEEVMQRPPQQVRMVSDAPTVEPQHSKPTNAAPSSHEAMLKKIFDKHLEGIEIDLGIDWADFPTNELNMLVDYFDVSKHEIAQYIIDHLIDRTSIEMAVMRFLRSKDMSE